VAYAPIRADLLRAVHRLCPAYLRDQAEDIVQAAMLRVMDALRRSEENHALPSSYLQKVAYCALIDELRRSRRRSEVPLLADDEEDTRAAPDPDPERASSGRQIGRAIRACLAAMIRPRSLAVTLHLQGYSVPELAGILAWNPKKADNLVYRGLADLRACLKTKGIER
jgi:RNA polymerase sigma-70 factor, ECF subfamily